MKLKIEYIKTDDLVPYAGNAKLHPAEQIEQIKKSIEQFGFNDPVAVWKDNEIIEGHGRLIAAKELGMDKIPIIRLDELTDEQRRAYTLVHNKLTMNSGFDDELLDLELESITDIDMSDFGFSLSDSPVETDIDYTGLSGVDVTAECETEEDAKKLFDELTERGYKCRTSTL